MKGNNLVLVGGGGHCCSCIEVIQSTGQYTIVGIVDKEQDMSPILGVPIIGDDDSIPIFKKKFSCQFMITLGQIKNSVGRRRLFNLVRESKGKIPVIIASTAFVSKYANIGNGSTVMHNVFINANATIGNGCIINTGALIEHDVQVDDYCHISTKAVVNGGVTIDSDCFIGSGVTISQSVSICKGCVIGAGSVVLHSIEKSGVYAGNPVRRIDVDG